MQRSQEIILEINRLRFIINNMWQDVEFLAKANIIVNVAYLHVCYRVIVCLNLHDSIIK